MCHNMKGIYSVVTDTGFYMTDKFISMYNVPDATEYDDGISHTMMECVNSVSDLLKLQVTLANEQVGYSNPTTMWGMRKQEGIYPERAPAGWSTVDDHAARSEYIRPSLFPGLKNSMYYRMAGIDILDLKGYWNDYIDPDPFLILYVKNLSSGSIHVVQYINRTGGDDKILLPKGFQAMFDMGGLRASDPLGDPLYQALLQSKEEVL